MQKNPSMVSCQSCPSVTKGIFCELAQQELDEVCQHKVVNNYKKGQTLFVQGNPPFGLFCISSGNIKLSRVGSDGKETIIRLASGGDVLGHRDLLMNQQHFATATAMEDTVVCFIDKKFIQNTIESKPSVALNLIEKISKEATNSEAQVVSLHQKNVRERLAELLLTLSNSHGKKQADGRTQLDLKLTREEMASIVGTANETLIRFMTEFKDEGLIEQEGKSIFITDQEKLADWANLTY